VNRVADRHLLVDPIACDGHGICAELLPEMIRLDDWGYPIIEDSVIPPELLDEVHLAIDACPVLALRSEIRRREAVRPRR
jgi:ferredoxin